MDNLYERDYSKAINEAKRWAEFIPEIQGDYSAESVIALLANLVVELRSTEFPEGWKLVEKETCYALLDGDTVVASLAGPDAERYAAIIARNLATPPAVMPAAPSDAVRPCEYCDDTGDVHGRDGEWRGVCICPAGAALSQTMQLQAAQPAGQEQAGAVKAYLMTRPSGFAWTLMPKDVTPEWREVCKAEGTTIEALTLAAPGAAIAAREQEVPLPEPVLCASSKAVKRMRAGDDHVRAWLPPVTEAEDMALFSADQMRSYRGASPSREETPSAPPAAIPAAPSEALTAAELRGKLLAAANYIDVLGGDSKDFRASLSALTQPTTVQQAGALAALRIHHEWSIRHMPGYSEHGAERVAYRATVAALKGEQPVKPSGNGGSVDEAQIEAAAKVIAQCMDYPWEHMPEQGRNNMRKHAKVIAEVIAPASQSGDQDRAELERLRALINTPQTKDWMQAVDLEAAHQQERWSVEHDGGKSPEDWMWLLGHLIGKAVAAFRLGDLDKGMHHIISSSATLRNWHRNVTGENVGMRPGINLNEKEPTQ